MKLIIYKKIKSMILFSLVLLFTISIFNSLIVMNFYQSNNEIPFDLRPNRTRVTDITSNNTLFSDPTVTPQNPKSNESVDVNLLIADNDGIQNSTLYWTYTSINDTLYNTSMSIDSSAEIIHEDDYSFNQTGYITDTGVITPSVTDWIYGETMYEGMEGEVISNIDLRIVRAGGGGNVNSLVYVLIEAKNLTTGIWETKLELGTIGSTAEVNPYPLDYISSQAVSGYRIYAITYIDTHNVIQPPKFDHIYLYRNEFSAKIPAANQSSFVDYFVVIYDELNYTAVSENNTFLMNWAPEIIIDEIPVVLKGTSDYLINVSVTDIDGVSSIDKSSVKAYYRLEAEEIWTEKSLDFIIEFGDNYLFNGTIPATTFQQIETNFYVMINASDTVDGSIGYESSTGVKTITIDNLGPRLTSITVDGGIIGIENVSLATENVTITADFEDPSGIESVNIYYKYDNGSSFVKLAMINSTDIEETISLSTFTCIIPAYNRSGLVDYLFETADFLDNTINTTAYYYYCDGEAPIMSNLMITPNYISNITDVTILFNATDFTWLRQSVIWYSYDDGTTWNNTVANDLIYDDHIGYEENFTYETLPAIIVNEDITLLTLEVLRKGYIDYATLLIELTHEKSTDIRIWLSSGEKDIVIFDRELISSNNINLEIDLLALGFSQTDFDYGFFSLKIQDFSGLYSGFIEKFQINLLDYNLPENYEFYAIIPASEVDTNVEFFITLTDTLWNDQNSSVYSYYSDGMDPTLIIDASLTQDIEGGEYISILAEVTDGGGIYEVELYYRPIEIDPWTIISMQMISNSSIYKSQITLYQNSGTIYFKIHAFDNAGHMSTSNINELSYINALAPKIEIPDLPYPNPLDLDGESTIGIQVNATDMDGTISSVEIVYKFLNESSYKTTEMTYDTNLGLYTINITIPEENGTITFKIEVTDNSSLITETEEYSINYINGYIEELETTPEKEPGDTGDIFLVLFIGTLTIASGGALTYIYRRYKSKEIDTTVSLDLPRPPET